MAYDRFDVVRVPFPFTDGPTARNRPALVTSDRAAFDHRARHSVIGAPIAGHRAGSHHPAHCPGAPVSPR